MKVSEETLGAKREERGESRKRARAIVQRPERRERERESRGAQREREIYVYHAKKAP